eukprot:gene29647-35785_t
MMSRSVLITVFFTLLLNSSFVDAFVGLNQPSLWENTRSCSKIHLHMHIDHSHSHSHHCHSHNDNPLSKLTQLTRHPQLLVQKPKGRVFLIAAVILTLSAIVRKKVSKVDLFAFISFSAVLSAFDYAKATFNHWLVRVKLVQDGIARHSTGIGKNYFFHNENVADRVTLLGVAINVILSVAKFFGGIVFHSAALVADAGHSLSDLFSDFITLWAVQIARLPPDPDHPYGHGKFESVGSLFLSLTLLATGLSVGIWSYDKLLRILQAQSLASKLVQHAVHTHAHSHAHLVTPSFPALLLALVSIVSKEWLFRVTMRVGEALHSQILIANAWHHRSDSFSSILSLFSIAAARYLPQGLVLDPIAGILVGGMICLTGGEVMMQALQQLTDSSNQVLVHNAASVARGMEGVKGVRGVKSRPLGAGHLVDMVLFVDNKLSTSAAHSIAERVRAKVMQAGNGEVLDVLVRTLPIQGGCPLLSHPSQRTVEDIERQVRQVLGDFESVQGVHRVTVHYMQPSPSVCIEVVLDFKASYTRQQLIEHASRIKETLLKLKDINQVEIQLSLSENESTLSDRELANNS